MNNKLTSKEKADVKRRFRKWLNYEPKVKLSDVCGSHIEYYINSVLTINYFNKENLVKTFLIETYLN